VTHSDDHLAALQTEIGYQFSDPSLLRHAMTHSSAAEQVADSNERLEFLGDAVVGTVVAERLYGTQPCLPEGEMTKIKSAAVSARGMGSAAERLRLQEYLCVDSGLSRKKKFPRSLIVGAYEALVAAVFLDGGFEPAKELVLRTLGPEVIEAEEQRHPPNFKAILQELVQAEGLGPPTYQTVKKTGPQHNLRFQAVCHVSGQEQGSGWGHTKREAEQSAAQETLRLRQGPQSHDEKDA